MTILIVDDEEDIIEGMLAGINFSALGIQQVYTATSSQEAKAVLEAENVDILLTDIEMPGESGLELLDWLRERDDDIVTMFCTSYANFDYAKKAVEMHSFDYYLKPIAYDDLQAHLAAAVEEVRKHHSESAYRQMGEYWLNGQKESRSIFWTKLLTSADPLGEVQKNGVESGLSYQAEETFSLWHILVADKESVPVPQWKAYGFRNVAEELLEGKELGLEGMFPDGSGWTMIFSEGGSSSPEASLLSLFQQAESLFNVLANGYYRRGIPLGNARAAYQEILQVSREDVLREHPLTDAAAYVPPKNNYGPAVIDGWAQLLAAGRTEELSRAVSTTLLRARASKTLSSGFLKAMRADLQQMVFAELNRRGINAHVLFSTPRYEELLAWSLDSVDRFQLYLDHLFQCTEEQIHFIAQADTVIGRVKAYVREHLSEEINRANVAKQFFLNPDYLARLFKKETGQTLGSYLQEQRVMEAKKLLCQSGLSIGAIAQKVGYDNYSYFSQFFHEKTGMSPSQFRKRYGSR